MNYQLIKTLQLGYLFKGGKTGGNQDRRDRGSNGNTFLRQF